MADRLFEKRSTEIILASAVERLLRSLFGGSAVFRDTRQKRRGLHLDVAINRR
jgi:hypothetical protein